MPTTKKAPARLDRPQRGRIRQCLELIKSEYFEMPGLHLTTEQMRRLFGCDINVCESAVGVLETAKFLRRTARGAYVRADQGA
jgi:hypothetical protein